MTRHRWTIPTALAAALAVALIGPCAALADVPAATAKRLHEAVESWTALAGPADRRASPPRMSDPHVRALFTALEAPDLSEADSYGAGDMERLLDMHGEVIGVFKRYLLALDANGQLDCAANENLYQDELATMVALYLDVAGAMVRAADAFMASLPPEEVTQIRIAGFKGARENYAEMILSMIRMVRKPNHRAENSRTLAAALARNGRWFADRLPEDHARAILNEAREAISTGGDRATADGLRTFVASAGLESD